MSENKPLKPGYLEPYSDEQMVYEALLMYANNRIGFANAISHPDYKNRDGEGASLEEIAHASNLAGQAERLLAYALEKLESPIIRLH